MRITPPTFTILALAPFSPALDLAAPPVVSVDSQSLDSALAELSPTLDIPVDKELCPDGSVAVTVKGMAGFRPGNLALGAPYLRELQAAKAHLAAGGAPAGLASVCPRVNQVLNISAPQTASRAAFLTASSASAKASALDDLLSLVDTGGGDSVAPSTPGGSLEEQLDALQGRLLRTIYADRNFRRLEAAWRGAELLARQVPSGAAMSVRLTLVPLPQGDCLPVFDLLETSLAGSPPDLALLDLPLANTPRDMAVLERALAFAEALLVPLAVPLGPKFLGIADWGGLDSVRYIPGQLEGAEYARWKTLAARPGAGWLAPCVGGILARPLHRPEPGFAGHGFSEAEPLWASAAWGLGALCAKSVAVHGRPTRLDERGSVSLDRMPLTDGPRPSALEVPLDLERLADFKRAGITPLAATPGRDQVFAAGAVTMDGGPLRFRLFLSLLTGFLIRTSATRRGEIKDLEADLAQAIALYIQALGLPAPHDLLVAAHEERDGTTPLDISLTLAPEILPGGQRFSFGFSW